MFWFLNDSRVIPGPAPAAQILKRAVRFELLFAGGNKAATNWWCMVRPGKTRPSSATQNRNPRSSRKGYFPFGPPSLKLMMKVTADCVSQSASRSSRSTGRFWARFPCLLIFGDRLLPLPPRPLSRGLPLLDRAPLPKLFSPRDPPVSVGRSPPRDFTLPSGAAGKKSGRWGVRRLFSSPSMSVWELFAPVKVETLSEHKMHEETFLSFHLKPAGDHQRR